MTPKFLKKLQKAVQDCWESKGGIGYKVQQIENKHEVIFFPSLRELIGGARDGEIFFEGFNFNIGKFVRVFDKPGPQVNLNCITNTITEHILFTGKINGVDVNVGILVSPPSGEHPLDKMYIIGPKAGLIEKN